MKILHCCLAAFYIDNYGYQENILPKVHKKQGHQVSIVASTETYIDNKNIGYLSPSSYINEHGIPVTRLPYARWLPQKLMRKIRAYVGLLEILEDFKPDIVFLHDVQFFDVRVIVGYVRRNKNVKVYADGHTDLINSARNWLSRNILHRLIYKSYAKKLEPVTEKFFGVTPMRVDFFNEMYGISRQKLDLLVLGFDDSSLDLSNRDSVRSQVREELGIKESEFVIISGGKIDKRKNIHLLLNAFGKLKLQTKGKVIKLVLFGTPTDEMKYLIENISSDSDIIYLGWLESKNISQYILASDLACYPGTHSVLWEQTVGMGIPVLIKKWKGMEHVDVGGNCVFLNEASESDIFDGLLSIIENEKHFLSMKNVALEKGIKEFSYFSIANKAIGLM